MCMYAVEDEEARLKTMRKKRPWGYNYTITIQ